MLSTILALLVMLNPFALFLYQLDIIRELSKKDFAKLFYKASATAFFLLGIFLMAGNMIFQDVFQVPVGTFRIFGGVIVLSYSIIFLMSAEKTLIKVRKTMDDTAAEIAMPFMIGAGTISVIILVNHEYSIYKGLIILMAALILNFLIVLSLVLIRDFINKKINRVAFDKIMQLCLHLNGFFIGAIGIDIIRQGLFNLYG